MREIALALSCELIFSVLVLQGQVLRELAVGAQAENQVKFLRVVQHGAVSIDGILPGVERHGPFMPAQVAEQSFHVVLSGLEVQSHQLPDGIVDEHEHSAARSALALIDIENIISIH